MVELSTKRTRQIPDGWTLRKIGDFSETSAGGTPLSSKKEYYDGGTIPWINSGEVEQNYINETTNYITELGFKNSSAKLFPKGSVLVALYGATAGKVSVLNFKASTNQAICAILPNSNFDSKFLKYYLDTLYDYLVGISSGSARDNLSQTGIRDLEVPLPNLATQQNIAAVLSSLDAKIELNNRINAQLEAMAKTLYDYWFVQFDFPDKNGKPYKSSGGKMTYDKKLKRNIPEGWEVKSIADWIDHDKCGDWGKETNQGNYIEKVICIRGTDINGLNGIGILKPPTRYILKKNRHKLLDSHDLIIEISGGAPTQSTGRLSYVTEETFARFDSPLICSNFCKAISLKEDKYLYSFAYLWSRLYDNGVFFGWEGKTSGIKNLLFEPFVQSYLTEKPEKTINEKFYKIIHPVQIKKQKVMLESQQLVELRDWLLPMLMNGQVSVK